MLNPINRSPSSPYDARMYVQQEQIEEEKKNKLRRNDATFNLVRHDVDDLVMDIFRIAFEKGMENE